jgi:hypothetical protein
METLVIQQAAIVVLAMASMLAAATLAYRRLHRETPPPTPVVPRLPRPPGSYVEVTGITMHGADIIRVSGIVDGEYVKDQYIKVAALEGLGRHDTRRKAAAALRAAKPDDEGRYAYLVGRQDGV